MTACERIPLRVHGVVSCESILRRKISGEREREREREKLENDESQEKRCTKIGSNFLNRYVKYTLGTA